MSLRAGIGVFFLIVNRGNDRKGDILWDTSKPDGTMQKLLDSSKFMSLGWIPKTKLDEGLHKTYHAWLEEKDL